jgi:hypothetical protein
MPPNPWNKKPAKTCSNCQSAGRKGYTGHTIAYCFHEGGGKAVQLSGLWSLFWTSVIARRICVARQSCFRTMTIVLLIVSECANSMRISETMGLSAQV